MRNDSVMITTLLTITDLPSKVFIGYIESSLVLIAYIESSLIFIASFDSKDQLLRFEPRYSIYLHFLGIIKLKLYDDDDEFELKLYEDDEFRLELYEDDDEFRLKLYEDDDEFSLILRGDGMGKEFRLKLDEDILKLSEDDEFKLRLSEDDGLRLKFNVDDEILGDNSVHVLCEKLHPFPLIPLYDSSSS
uniref:Uncharacterized protein n=1 Tax=Rhizophagus irregularis (strain DAOM 181602 / DAOM 197198 / MUCL 43194) TaxID=747089 RepID=U9UMR2_RHIID